MIELKFKFPPYWQVIGIVIVVFLVASSIVGFMSVAQTLAGPASVQGLQGYGSVGSEPMKPAPQAAVYSYTATTMGKATYGGRMIELEGYVTIEVADAKAASNQATTLASSLGGYVASSSFDESSSSANIVLRVPEQNFTSALRELGALGRIKAQSTSSNDVTEDYVNLQAQLDSYQAEYGTLIRILNSSTKVSDALSTEEAIQQVQANINQIEGQLLVIHRLVTFATINTQLVEPPSEPKLDFGDAVRSAILSFYVVVKGMLILGAAVAPIAMLGGIAYYPYRRFSKRKGKMPEAKLTGTT